MNRDQELRFIREELGYLGVKEFPEKGVADLVNSGSDKIQVTGELAFAQYGKREDLSYKIFLKKYDYQSNRYHPYAYHATLKSDPAKSRAFEIRPDAYLTLQDAFNLLNARAVQKLVLNHSSQKIENTWFQLDFSKTDANGNVKLDKLSDKEQDFSIGRALSRYPIKERMLPDERVNLLRSLSDGNAQPVTVVKRGKEFTAFAQADPKNTTVRVYANWNGKMMKVAMPDNDKPEKKQEESLSQEEHRVRRRGKSL